MQSGIDINILTLQTKNSEWMRAFGEDHGRVVAFLPVGESIISRYSHCFRIRDIEKIRSAVMYQEPQAGVSTIKDLVDVNKVTISPNGQYLVSEDETCVHLWCLSDDTYEGCLAVHFDTIGTPDDVKILSFSSDSESLMLCTKNMVYVWTLRKIRHP
ncbi:uncharacterized protein BKA55DRAFT_722073, partial [Fusarium redolens]